LFAAMLNSRNRPINIQAKTLLIPRTLEMVASTIVGSPVMIGMANDTPNPFRGRFNIVASPYIDAHCTTEWYLGDFPKQFVWKEVIPLQVLQRGRESEEGWQRDLLASYKVRFYGICAATDYVYVVMSTGTV